MIFDCEYVNVVQRAAALPTILKHFRVVVCQLIHQTAACVQLPKRQLVMVLVIQHVDQVRIERVNILRREGSEGFAFRLNTFPQRCAAVVHIHPAEGNHPGCE